MEKSLVLIDAENVIKPWGKYCREHGLDDKVNYVKLLKELSKGTNLLRAYFYDGIPETIPAKKKSFLEALEKQGIQLRTKILKKRIAKCPSCEAENEKYIQKGVDVSLATDILRHVFQKTCDVCIIVSGDEDYKDAIELAKDRGIKVWVCSFKCSLSPAVRRIADKVFILDELFDKVKF